MALEKVYFHVDLDAFFASVEQKVHPEWKGKPVIVGGLPGDRRAVVSTASYEARAYGVHSAMPLVTAVKLCPNGIYTRGNMKLYQEISEQVMEIFTRYSPEVLQMSVDEAFLDMTGTERLLGKPVDVAKKLKAEVFEKTGLTVSVGVAGTMYVSKIASGYKKPDGLTFVPHGDEEKFMLSLPLDKLWGAGDKTLSHIRSAGLKSMADIYEKSESLLQVMFGSSMGTFLYEAVRGNKGMIFGEEAKNHSLSSETTYDFDLTDIFAIETALMELCENVIFRMHRQNCRSRTVVIKIRYGDFTTVSARETSEWSVNTVDDLFERAKRIFEKKYEAGRGIRLLGVGLSNVESKEEMTQGSLFDFGEEKKTKVEEAVFKLNDKHSEIIVHKARTLLK